MHKTSTNMQRIETKSKDVRRNLTMPSTLDKKVMEAMGFLIMEKKGDVTIQEAINYLIEKGYESLPIQKSA